MRQVRPVMLNSGGTRVSEWWYKVHMRADAKNIAVAMPSLTVWVTYEKGGVERTIGLRCRTMSEGSEPHT
jgi:hypothetical protein